MSLKLRSEVVAEARSWIGTPFKWQASVKGSGCDCMGLVAGVARERGRTEDAPRWNYTKINPRELKAGLAACFDPVSEAEAGDILLLRIGNHGAIHLAIYVGGGRMVHTYQKIGKVIEVPMGSAWWGQVDSIWTWRRHVG